jgi:SulP family sulfate permease
VLPDGVVVYAIDGPFFFAAVESFERALTNTHTDPRVVIFRFGRVPFVDITGIHALEGVIADLQQRHVRVILCEANPQVAATLARAGITRLAGAHGHVESIADALDVAEGRTPERTEAAGPGAIRPITEPA